MSTLDEIFAIIQHERNRSVTFLKRKNGLFKKAYELGVLCSVDVAVIIFEDRPGHDLKLHQYSSSDIRDIIQRQLRHQGERDAKGPSDFSGSGGKDDENGDGDDDAVEEEEEPPARPAKRKATGKAAVTPSAATPTTNGAYTPSTRNGRSAQTPLSVHGVRGFEEGPSTSSVLPVSNDRVSNLRETNSRSSNKRTRSETDADPETSRSPSEDTQPPRSSLFLPEQQNTGRGYVRQIRYPHEMGPPQDSGSFNHVPMQPPSSHSLNYGYNPLFSNSHNSTLSSFSSSRGSPPQHLQNYSRDIDREAYFPPRGKFSDSPYDMNSYSNSGRHPLPSSSGSGMHFSQWPQQSSREGRMDFSVFLEVDQRSRQQENLLNGRSEPSGLEWPTHETSRASRGTMGPPVSHMHSSLNTDDWFDAFSSNADGAVPPENKDMSRTQGTSWERNNTTEDMAQVFESTKKQITSSRPSASNALQGIMVPDVPPPGGSMMANEPPLQIPDITISMARDSVEPPAHVESALPADTDVVMDPPSFTSESSKHCSLDAENGSKTNENERPLKSEERQDSPPKDLAKGQDPPAEEKAAEPSST
ncbi:hypothetical protein CVT24_001272 [Panaeolus cyanescens]|uniref:MADS-box domain-containing protein n=1 Tax=Panaeolus cyanescens TaxID=181874 RepID=A0A409YFZ3_9AGAR|nr:hypothetical protein CVT24_001272 [Panaeolus cyanescens]